MNLPAIGSTVRLRVNAPAPENHGVETLQEMLARLATAAPPDPHHDVDAVVVGHSEANDDGLHLDAGGMAVRGVLPSVGGAPGWFVEE